MEAREARVTRTKGYFWRGVQSHGHRVGRVLAIWKGGPIPRGRWRNRIPCKRTFFTTTSAREIAMPQTPRSGHGQVALREILSQGGERDRLISAPIVRITTHGSYRSRGLRLGFHAIVSNKVRAGLLTVIIEFRGSSRISVLYTI